jgi:Tol biopolymer transport system component
MRLLDNGNFCVGGMVGSSNNGNIQSPGQGNGNTNVGSAMWTEGRFICNSASSFSSFGRNSSGTVLSFTRQGGDQGAISVAVGSVSYGSGSDYRLKENVVSLTDGITRVKQLVPKRFNFIEDTTNTLLDGFLAHEVSSIVPEAITGTKDAVDSDNNPVYQQIDQAKLVPLLTAALQEAITKIETLETKVAALEAG